MNTRLTNAQHERLDKLADEQPHAKVVGWHPAGGPIIHRNTTWRYVDGHGRLKPISKSVLQQLGLVLA